MKTIKLLSSVLLALSLFNSFTVQAREMAQYEAVILDHERPALDIIAEAKIGLKACKGNYGCRIEFQSQIYNAFGGLLISRYSHLEKTVASEMYRYIQNVRELYNTSKGVCSTTFGVIPLRNDECHSRSLNRVNVIFEHAFFNELERI